MPELSCPLWQEPNHKGGMELSPAAESTLHNARGGMMILCRTEPQMELRFLALACDSRAGLGHPELTELGARCRDAWPVLDRARRRAMRSSLSIVCLEGAAARWHLKFALPVDPRSSAVAESHRAACQTKGPPQALLCVRIRACPSYRRTSFCRSSAAYRCAARTANSAARHLERPSRAGFAPSLRKLCTVQLPAMPNFAY